MNNYVHREEIVAAIRRIQEVKSGSIKIDLPAEFDSKNVEVIVLPIDESIHEEQCLRDLLLNAPILTDIEFQEYNKVREWMNN